MKQYLKRAGIAATLLAAICGTTLHAEIPTRYDAADDVFYHYMPIAWRDSDNDAQRFGDFDGMTAGLDYLEELGVTAVWMNPIFPSPAYHGYQHNTADQLNSRFGSEANFLNFVQQAHARGIRVFIDIVLYGINRDNAWFQDAYGNPSSPYDDWFAFTNSGNTEYLGSTYTTWNSDTVRFIHWNLNNQNPVDLVTGWSTHWLDPNGDGDPADGIDGYRLDHVWLEYPSGPNGWGYNLDDFWIPWKQAMQSVNPNVFTFAEQADWGSHGAELLAAHDAAMTKPFEFAARDALVNETAASLYSQMEATVAALPPTGTFLGIIGDHDVDRLTSLLGGDLEKAKAAAAILLTQPFPPIIYHGDEIGMLGVKNSGYSGDAADIPMREPFKWNAVAGPPMTNYFVLNSEAYQNRFARDNDGRSVEEQLNVAGSLLEEYKLLIATRQANVGLRRGTYHSVSNSSSRIWAFVRDHAQQQLLVAINVYGAARSFTLDLSDFGIPGGATTPTDVISGQLLPDITDANKGGYPLNLPAYGYQILEVELMPPAPPQARTDGRGIPADLGPAALVATQDNATGLGDNVSELNQLFARASGADLLLGLTGNLNTDGTGLALFFDTKAGGQNVLDLSDTSPPPAGPDKLTGLIFDPGFEPDHLLFVNAWSGTIYVDQFELLTGGGTDKSYRGNGTVNDGDGFLLGGSNPNGMEVALDNSNIAGVTDSDPSGAATATTGFELVIPYADIGLAPDTTASVGIVAFLMRSDGDVSNQWLPGLGGGYGNLGAAPDMTNIPGEQFTFVTLNVLGDLNCDGAVNGFDIDHFIQALNDWDGYIVDHDGDPYPPCDPWLADANHDGAVNGFDIDAFVALLAGG
ncbi:MAG: alpha-glucosidase C-terminal domain-containing protein [Planctomycetes bacterium]|nr:alpha-glucosidase C-terminal domain-containing protein [Planctomycetota bacterium]